MRVNGPDGRAWEVVRVPDPPGALASLRPGGRWLVEARTDGETRRWECASRRAAGDLVEDVALALRTGGEGPPGELSPGEARTDRDDEA